MNETENGPMPTDTNKHPRMFNKYFQIRWNEKIGRPECPYMRRWVFHTYFFSIRLHQWYRSDDRRYLHDHPWSFITFVLKGEYTDVSEGPEGGARIHQTLHAGKVQYRKAEHRHYVSVPGKGCWTLLLTGRHKRNWGFYIPGRAKLMRPLRFFHRYGYPPCDEQ